MPLKGQRVLSSFIAIVREIEVNARALPRNGATPSGAAPGDPSILSGFFCQRPPRRKLEPFLLVGPARSSDFNLPFPPRLSCDLTFMDEICVRLGEALAARV